MTDLEKQKNYEETKDDMCERIFQIRLSYDAYDLGEETFEEGAVVYSDDNFEIETVLNLKLDFKYFKFIRYEDITKFGKVCRIRIDKPEYVYYKDDTILSKDEKEKLLSILNRKLQNVNSYWERLIELTWLTYRCYSNDQYPTSIPDIPDYNKLEEIL